MPSSAVSSSVIDSSVISGVSSALLPQVDDLLNCGLPYCDAERLAEGGFGRVFKVREPWTPFVSGRDHQVLFRTDVVVKASFRDRVPPEVVQSEILAANLLARCRGSVVSTLMEQVGELVVARYELVRGKTLGTLLQESCPSRRMPVLPALEYVHSLLCILERIHMKGVSHCDVKPDNVMVTEDGMKVIDFGLLRKFGERCICGPPASNCVMGSCGHIAPEQASAEPVGPTTDVYGAGCVLYELLIGDPPYYNRRTAYAMMRAHVNS